MQVTIFIVADTYIRYINVQQGEVIQGHKHTYDHASLLTEGIVEVNIQGIINRYIAPSCILIKKDEFHAIKAISNATWSCIHNISKADPDYTVETWKDLINGIGTGQVEDICTDCNPNESTN